MVLAAEARRSLRKCARFCRSWFSLSGPSGLPDLRAARPGDALRPIFLLRAAFPALFRPPTSSSARVLPAGPSLCWEAVEGQAMVFIRCWPSAPPRRPNSTAPTIPPDLDATESAHMQSHVRSRAHLSNGASAPDWSSRGVPRLAPSELRTLRAKCVRLPENFPLRAVVGGSGRAQSRMNFPEL